jgi:hypothetical protein
MRLSIGRRHFLAGVILGITGTAGCGTILYPERRGQPAGRLDWGVVALDGVGLLLFFVPGVIAFAVDFATGSIYLPPAEDYQLSRGERPPRFKRIQLADDSRSRPAIAAAIGAETGRAPALHEGAYYTAKLSDLGGFWPAHDALAQQHENRAQPG